MTSSDSSQDWQLARKTLLRWQTDPSLFVRQTLKVTPEAWQDDALKAVATHNRVAIRSGHRVGKTAFLSWVIIWFMATRFPVKIPCTANTASQVHDVLWAELAKWHRRLVPELQAQFEHKADRYELKAAPNESFAVARTARKEQPEAFQGFHSDNLLFIADEASGIDEAIFEATQGVMAGRSARTLLTGNPTRNNGFFFQAFNRSRALWHPIHVPCSASTQVDPAYIRDMATQYGEHNDIYRVRVLGEFPKQSSLQFIGNDLVDEAKAREPVVGLQDPFVIGVDVARFGDDQTVICFRKGRDARTHPPVKLRGADTMLVAGRVAEEYQRYRADAVFVDGGGLGAGVVDRLRQMRVPVIEIQFGGKADRHSIGTGVDTASYANKRAEMWGNMRDWLKGGSIPDDPELAADLTGVEYGFNVRNEIQLERKEDMKKRGLASPDNGDALALTFAYPVMPNAHAGGAHAPASNVMSDYDPLAAA